MPREPISFGKPETLKSGKIRWKKMYKGNQWKSPAYDQESRRNKSEAWQLFVEWREKLKQELEGQEKQTDPNFKLRKVVIDKVNVVAAHSRLMGDMEEARTLDRVAKTLETADLKELLETSVVLAQNIDALSYQETTVQQAIKNSGHREDLSAGKLAQDYLHELQIRVKSQQASTGQYGVKRNAITQFVDWFGASRGLNTLSEKDVADYYNHLIERIANGENPNTLSTYHGKIKKFLEDVAMDNPEIPLPKNLKVKRYVIKPTKPKVETFTVDECTTLLELASPRVELWLLLMLNIGAYQGDISDLKGNEVDWEDGRIIRARSKEANAPTINYLLWDRTWELLQQQGRRTGLVLSKQNGDPLVTHGIKPNGKEWRRDAIVSSWRHLVKKAKRPVRGKSKFPHDWHKSLKQFRKTGSSLIETSPHAEFVDMFLDHSRVARRHYLKGQIVPKFDAAVRWLGNQFGLETTR